MKKSIFIFCIAIIFASCKKNGASTIKPPVEPKESVRDSVFTSYFERTSGWTGSDGGASIHLSDGRTLWLWGDSNIGGYNASDSTIPCIFQVNNSALLQSSAGNADMTTLIGTGRPASLFLHPGGWPAYLFWPGSGYQQGDTVYILLQSIKNTGTGLGFSTGGANYIGKMKFPEMTVEGVQQLPKQGGVSYGVGFIKQDDTFTYAYGSKNDGFLGTELYVARLKSTNPAGAPWEYYTGDGWSTDTLFARKIAADGASSFSCVFKVKNKYVALSTEFSLGCTGKNIYAFTSDNPEGPFLSKQIIYQIPEMLDGKHPFFYSAEGHPEFIDDRGVLITYCVNGFLNCGPQVCINHRKKATWYRPKAFRVPLQKLGL